MAQTFCLKIYCPANKCLKAYQDILRQVDGVETVVFNLVNMSAIVSGNMISADALLKKLRESGKRAKLCSVAQSKIQKMKAEQQKEVQLSGHKDNGQPDENTLVNYGPIMFERKTLAAATNNFCDEVGRGGFGYVYKGTTQDRKEIAVKKLSDFTGERKKRFWNEVHILAQCRHRNIVKLLGYCAEELEGLLVYEYCPNKSLDEFLFHPNKCNALDWHKRYNIILGIANGLLYLHRDSPQLIVHGDIKPENILLDEKLNPKIADFDISKLFPEDKTHVSTEDPKGTHGYVAPEHATSGKSSPKADVYSFGVVLLELVTGEKELFRKPIVLRWVWDSFEKRESAPTIDPQIIQTCDMEEATRCIHVGFLCTQTDTNLRPSMADVIRILSKPYGPLPNPKKPLLCPALPGSGNLPACNEALSILYNGVFSENA